MLPERPVPRPEAIKPEAIRGLPVDFPIDACADAEEDAVNMEHLKATVSEQADKIASLVHEVARLKRISLVNEDIEKSASKAALEDIKQPLATRIIEKATFWMDAEEKDVSGYSLMMKKPVHVPSHAVCLLFYFALMAAYSAYSIVTYIDTPPETSFSSEEAIDFGPIFLNIAVDCSNCNAFTDGTIFKITSNYDGVSHCEQDGIVQMIDQPAPSILFCRSSDDIGKDSRGIDIVIGNIGESTSGEPKRATVYVSHGDMKVTTPVERWHEKTLLLGLTVTRDSEDCVSSEDCNLERNAYLASMQYDGKVEWPTGGIVHIRMLRFANVYTIAPAETIADIGARIGGASGLLILVLGGLRKVMGSRKEAGDAAVATASVAAVAIGMGE